MIIELGDEAKDTITGFQGVVVARTEWISGCDRIILQPKVGKDGKIPDSNSFDEPMLVVTKKKKVAKEKTKTGGPRPNVFPKMTPTRI